MREYLDKLIDRLVNREKRDRKISNKLMDSAVIKNQAKKFLNKIFQSLKDQKIDLKNWEVDHICYRTSSQKNYSETKKIFCKLGQLLIESEVNGRLIATYKLSEPIVFQKWIINLVEVPAPKAGKFTKEGFEHIEVVIDQSFDELISTYPGITFHKKGLLKDLNPELEIEFDSCAIKFHHKSLEHIINIEKNLKIIKFLHESKIFSNLKMYTPCISGTFPLGIHNSKSYLDILFSSHNLDKFLKDVTKFFGHRKNFSTKFTKHQNLQTLIINFEFNDLPIEFFCQNKTVYNQPANQHFLIEGRLLKILGENFKEKIELLKTKGEKTEPAFGKILGLKSPYQDLIELNLLSDLELYKRFKSIKSNSLT